MMVALLDEAERAKTAPKGTSAVRPAGAPGAEQKPETPSKAEPAGEKAKAPPGKGK
jgi:hypothetical protein